MALTVTQDELKCNILEPSLKTNTKSAILKRLWDVDCTLSSPSYDHSLCDSYFRYYREQCRNALLTNGLNAILATHQDIIDIILQLRDLNSTREEIKDCLRARHLPHLTADKSERLLCEAIDLAVCLWLMADVGEMRHSPLGKWPAARSYQCSFQPASQLHVLENQVGEDLYCSKPRADCWPKIF